MKQFLFASVLLVAMSGFAKETIACRFPDPNAVPYGLEFVELIEVWPEGEQIYLQQKGSGGMNFPVTVRHSQGQDIYVWLIDFDLYELRLPSAKLTYTNLENAGRPTVTGQMSCQ